MKAWWIISIIFILTGIFSCKSIKYVPVEIKTTETVEVHDTTIMEKLIQYKDSISTPDTTSFLSNPYGYSWATYSNGILYHSLGIWPNAFLSVNVPKYMTITRTVEVPKIVEVEKKLTRWQQFKVNYCGYIIVILIVIVFIVIGQMVYKLKK